LRHGDVGGNAVCAAHASIRRRAGAGISALAFAVVPVSRFPMATPASTPDSAPRPVLVREMPIELCQFLKFAGVASSGGEAKQSIAEGRVALNGVVETRKRKQLAAGDQVTFGGHTLVVQVVRPGR